MKPWPKTRKTIKWGGAVLGVLLAVVWIGSGWWEVRWWGQNGSVISVGQGRFEFGVGVLLPNRYRGGNWHLGPEEYPFRWWFDWGQNSLGWWFEVPIWFPALISLALAATAFRLDTLARRRGRPGVCKACGYDLVGLAAGAVCPECGGKGVGQE